MKYYHCWSGGKDSTASIILDHMYGLPPSKIIMSEVMFDRRRNISGELPEHMEWVHNIAIPQFKSWGYSVEILHADKDYLDLFYHVINRSKYPERNGKLHGWVVGGKCDANRDLKIKPIRDYCKTTEPYTQYVGIALDEPKRLQRLKQTNRVSLLEKYGYTEKMAYNLCQQYNLLSPIYETSKRNGCWFCPNCSYKTFADVKEQYPELWEELKKLSHTENLVSYGFKYGETFASVNTKVDNIICQRRWARRQTSIFDTLED